MNKDARPLFGSFAVYLVPLVGPHAAWLLGEHLYAELTRGGGRSPAWVAADVATALVAQALLYVLLRRVLAGRSAFRWLAMLAAPPVFFVALEWAYLLAIPSYFLIERDVAPEQARWAEECFLPDVGIATVRTPPDLPLARAGRVWINGTNGRSLAVLESCERRTAIDFGAAEMLAGVPFVVADGSALFSVWDKASQRNTWWYYAGGEAKAAPLERPPADPDRSAPILSNDGSFVAWKEYVPGVTRTPLPEQIIVRSLRDEREDLIPLPPPGPRSIELLGVDTEARTLTVFAHEYATRSSSIVTLGFDGAPRGRPLVAEGIEPQSTTFSRIGDGWLGWDAYREEGRYRVAWSLAGSLRSSEVLLGRGITAVAADPSGSYVAVSTTTALNIGAIRDSVYVLSAKDGAEVFRRYLPTYSRSGLAFLGAERFAYEDRDGERFGLRILRIPPVG